MKERPGELIHNSSPAGVSSFYKHIPNILTFLRLLGTPLTVWIIGQGRLTTAFWVFFAICMTDWLDGYLARRWQATSKLGQMLDPLADKFLMISVYLALGLWEFIPLWLTTLVLTRDVLILLISSIVISGKIVLTRKAEALLAPKFIGKISTALQMLFIGLTLATEAPVPSLPTSSIGSSLMVFFLYSVALITILSGITYARVAFTAFRQK